MSVDKIEWIRLEDGKEALVIPKDLIQNITEKLQGVKVIETKPEWVV